MSLKGPIIYVDDDTDDIEVFLNVMRELKVRNKIITFRNTKDAMSYLRETKEQPFLIACDVNLPKQGGLEFKSNIDANPYLRKKSIPFMFFSTSVNQVWVNDAYTKMTIQGFFIQESTYEGTISLWQSIIAYWQRCVHPNT